MSVNSKYAIGVSLVLFLTLLPTLADEPWYSQPDPRFFPHESPLHDTAPPQLGPRRTSPPLPPEALRRNGYQSVQVNVDEFGNNILGDAANEPSIAIDPTDPSKIVIGWRQFDTIASNFRQAGWAYSHDAGQTWTFPGVLEEGVFRSDPVLAPDADGNFYFLSLKFDFTCSLFKSTNSGLFWSSPQRAYGGDKAWMAIDRTGGLGHGNIYCDYTVYPTHEFDFIRSTSGGLAFEQRVHISENPHWGTVTVAPNGDVYMVGGYSVNFSNHPMHKIRRSSRSLILLPGSTWAVGPLATAPPIPGV